VFAWTYMTVIGYAGAFLIYQLGSMAWSAKVWFHCGNRAEWHILSARRRFWPV